MKFSYSWLKQLVDIKLSPEKLAEFLSLHAFETEVVSGGQEFPNIIVAKVTKVEKHPNADRLRVITLEDGSKTIGPVVCGAWNFDVGAVVPLALSGAIIPHDQHDPEGKPFTLGKATIRGIESQGMICSAKELGLSADGAGILLLDKNRTLGETFSVKPDSDDVILDVSVPANRPDLVSYRGVAWEIAALTGKKYLVKQTKPQASKFLAKVLKVRVSDVNLCKKYLTARLVNVKIRPSPKFIQERLKSSGVRSVNNVVDITNYVMLEVGQPLHAFDAGKVAGAINVRKAYVQESLATLDGVNRKLTPEMLVIADNTKVLAVAGVMGGESSAINEHTVELILESANFNAVSVRRTSRALGLRTDASSRFEKSLPVAFTGLALEYACELLEKYANAKTIEFAQAGTKPEKHVEIKLDPEKVNKLLGTNVLVSEQKKIFTKFGFGVKDAKSQLTVSVPFWRPDVTIWQDLAEEVERYKGLDFIKPQAMSFPVSGQMSDKSLELRDEVSDYFVGMGFNEAYTYSFVSEEFFDKNGLDKKLAVEIANPLTSDQKFLRLGIGMNYEKLVAQNSEFTDEEGLFEIANVYRKNSSKIDEHTNLFALYYSKHKNPSAKLIGALRELFQRYDIDLSVKQTDEETGEVHADRENIGVIRAVNGEVNWAAAELDFHKLSNHIKQAQYRTIGRFPKKKLDTSVLVREDLQWAEIKSQVKHSLIVNVELLEVYQGKNITVGKKGVTFQTVYQAHDRTLTDEEVNKIQGQILATLKAKLNATVRD